MVQSEVTNMDDQPFSMWNMDGMLGIDEVGNRYEYEDQVCQKINPGATEPCTLVFDVPQTVTLIGLDLTAPHRKTIRFQPTP